VPFIVKPPGKNEAITYSTAFNTILTHDLILSILRRQITNQQDLVPWFIKNGKLVPTLNVGKQE
jgi:hypothetical protein